MNATQSESTIVRTPTEVSGRIEDLIWQHWDMLLATEDDLDHMLSVIHRFITYGLKWINEEDIGPLEWFLAERGLDITSGLRGLLRLASSHAQITALSWALDTPLPDLLSGHGLGGEAFLKELCREPFDEFHKSLEYC